MKCNHCGAQNDESSAFCEDCGQLISEETVNAPPILSVTEAGNFDNSQRTTFSETELRYLEASPYKIDSCGSSAAHIGFVKDEQEDRTILKMKSFDRHGLSVYIAAVADGMGGYDGGEICAEIGVEEFALAVYEVLPAAESQMQSRTDFVAALEKTLGAIVPKALSKANRRVRAYLAQTGQQGGGAIMVACAVLVDHTYGRVKIFGYSQGDARALLSTSHEQRMLTQDHAINGKPTRYLGAKDAIGLGAFEEDHWFVDSDIDSMSLVLYTDGLWQMLSESEISEVVRYASDASQIARGLVKAALTVDIPAGARQSTADGLVTLGDDNISVVAIRFTKTSEGDQEDDNSY